MNVQFAVLISAVAAGVLLPDCSSPEQLAARSMTEALGEANCADLAGCTGNLVCVENAAGPGQNRCEEAHALYSFLERDPDNLALAFEETMGLWRTERAQTQLVTVPYPMQLASGEVVTCKDTDTASPHACFVPDWRAYVAPNAIADKYDRFALFGLRPLRFLVDAWQHESDAQLSAMARARGLAQSPATIRANMRSSYLAALDSFTTATPLPFALASDPAPSTPAGWLNPNSGFDPGLALWDPASNNNCKTEKSVPVAGFPGLTYYDLRSSLWDRHASAFRSLTLLNGYFHARGLLTSTQASRWLGVLHGLADALSLSSSFEPGANHGITEAAALLQLASEFDGSATPRLSTTASLTSAWKALARERLNSVISQTVLPDGAQVEQSLFYHDYELSFLVEIQDWIRRHPDAALATGDLSSGYDFGICQNGTTFDNHIDPDPNLDLAAVVQAATRVATHTAMPSTEVPMLGSSPTCNLQTFWATSFGAYVEHDTSDVVQQFQFVRSGGASGVSIPLSQRMQVFPNAGYVTLRSAFAPSYAAQTHVLFNVGVPANAHSHLDALSLHLYAQDPTTAADNDGLPLLTDSGWFSYTNSQRHYFESTGAHSTVTVDGLNQCSFDPTGKRADPTSPSSILGNCAAIVDGYPMSRAHLGSSLSDPGGLDRVLYQSAETSLYAGVTHQRGVALFGRDLVLVLDHLKSASTHSLQQNWQLGPAVASIGQATASGNTAHYLFRGANGAALFSGHFAGASDSAFSTSRGTCGSCTGNLCAGNECADPRRGWFSLVENSKTPSWALQRQGTAKEVTWASAFLLGGLAAQNATVTLTRLATNDYQLDATVQDGMTVSVRVDGFATAAEAVDISYPLRGAFASYSFEGNPATNQDLKEDLAVSISAAGETNDNVVSRAGVVGRAYEYASGGTQLGSGGSFAFMHKPGAKFSLSFWLRMASTNSGATGGTQAIFSTGTWSNTGTGIQLYFQDDASHDNTLRFVVRGGGSTPVSFQSPARFIPEDTLWHHYVVAFEAAASSDQIHLYRDGANGVTAQFSGNLSTAANDASPTLGKKPGTGVAFPLHASLDEFVFFKRALSGADAMALFNGGQGMRAH